MQLNEESMFLGSALMNFVNKMSFGQLFHPWNEHAELKLPDQKPALIIPEPKPLTMIPVQTPIKILSEQKPSNMQSE